MRTLTTKAVAVVLSLAGIFGIAPSWVPPAAHATGIQDPCYPGFDYCFHVAAT
jgi:hypothetical protein